MSSNEELAAHLSAEYPSAPADVIAVACHRVLKGQEQSALQLLAPWKPRPEDPS